jgi:hypothetical protein
MGRWADGQTLLERYFFFTASFTFPENFFIV